MEEKAIYNTIGKAYDSTRNPDQQIVQTLLRLMKPKQNGHYLDVACGSGNYTNALFELGVNIEGIDISEEMLGKARKKNPKISWHQGDAKNLPFKDSMFDGAICTLATHHMGKFEDAFKEVSRVIKSGKFVILTATSQQMKNYWLCHYFPLMMEDSALRMSSFERVEKAYLDAGFSNIKKESFFATDTLTDWFLYSGKYRPQMYLDPKVRAGISSFHVSANDEEIKAGLTELEVDIASGKINDIIKQYESDGGDYMFVVGEK